MAVSGGSLPASLSLYQQSPWPTGLRMGEPTQTETQRSDGIRLAAGMAMGEGTEARLVQEVTRSHTSDEELQSDIRNLRAFSTSRTLSTLPLVTFAVVGSQVDSMIRQRAFSAPAGSFELQGNKKVGEMGTRGASTRYIESRKSTKSELTEMDRSGEDSERTGESRGKHVTLEHSQPLVSAQHLRRKSLTAAPANLGTAGRNRRQTIVGPIASEVTAAVAASRVNGTGAGMRVGIVGGGNSGGSAEGHGTTSPRRDFATTAQVCVVRH
ncbi:unnamed protein product [Choristocarpus tenellus]